MRKLFYSTFLLAFLLSALTACNSLSSHRKQVSERIEDEKEDEENDGYDGPAERDRFEFEQIKDPRLGYVPTERMFNAVDYTDKLKTNMARSGRTSGMTWTERGPIYDSVGPSNGNTRGGSNNPPGTYTAGRTAAILIDTLNDPSGNTAFCGGISGGLWLCTNFLSSIPNWRVLNDKYENLAVSSICQDPSNPSVMYFSTGEATSNADAVYGGGIFKSTNAGITWNRLPSTTNFIRNFKIACDARGNVFLAARPTTIPAIQPYGLLRSTDKGNSWQNITPRNLTSSNAICTDIEISSTGRLHASFGYNTGGTTNQVQYSYTTTPATVSDSTGWNSSTGIRSSGLYSLRLELATLADTLYAATVNSAANVDSIYKSVNGGATWTKQNTTTLPTGILSGQGWYNITLAINPSNSSQFLIGGLDAYRSVNSGVTIPTRVTYWVSTAPYVHADHHFMQWWNYGAESRVVIGCDGGVFYSNNGGATFADKNRNLAIKQFYAAAIHPAQGSNYLIAGAQDNGVHQLKNAGLSYSTEVTGGDGCFVHINQQNPQIQFGSYVYNSYRRSVNGGATWSSVTLSSSAGLFVNPFDYDDGQNIMYASYGPNQIVRWRNAATTNNDTALLTMSAFTKNNLTSNPTAFKVSPFTKDRVFIGGSTGKIIRLDNSSTVTQGSVNANVTDISGANFPTSGYVSCVNTGSSDDYLVATFSSYGVKHVWYSINAGNTWTNIDGMSGAGGLPDMPVRWAVFDPQNNNKLILATEAGVYTTDAINGSNTVWTPDESFPTVRTDMLKIRLSDNTMVAATHGRGLFTAVLPSTPEIRFNAPFASVTEGPGTQAGCVNYKDYTIDLSIIAPPLGDATITYSLLPGDSAIEGKDFNFTTNGDFTNPSKQQTFTNGAMSTKQITVRVYDDAEAEGSESFRLTFNISGSTNAIAGNYKTFKFTIDDNDFAPTLPFTGNVTSTIGGLVYYLSYTGGSAPLDQKLASKRSQFLYTASELTGFGLKAGNIFNMQLPIWRSGTSRGYSNFSVKMGATTRTVLIDSSNFYAVPTRTVKKPYTFNPTAGSGYVYNTIAFDSTYAWDGVSSIVVEICYNNGTADTASSTVIDRTVGYTDGLDDTRGNLIWQDNIDCGSAFNGNSADFSFFSGGIKPTVRFGQNYFSGTLPATALNSAKTENFVTGSISNNFYFYLPSGPILASFKDLSNFNYGCTEVRIDRAGTTATRFWNNTDSATFLMDKTYFVTPTTNSNTAPYEATFYFSPAEKDGWEAVTKQRFENIRLIKVSGAVSSVTPTNQQPNAVQIILPTGVGKSGENYYVTARLSSSLSGGFGFGIPNANALPITLLDFKGSLRGDNAFLEWSTSSEMNSKEFQLEKSFDGVLYHKFATVKAAGNSFITRTYNTLDNEIAVNVNYYRLKMLDLDNSSKYSNVVILKNPNNKRVVSVINNPFNNYIDLQLVNIPTGKVKIQLNDVSGKLVQSQSIQNTQGQYIYRLNINSTISRGIYFLTADADGQKYTIRVMKQ